MNRNAVQWLAPICLLACGGTGEPAGDSSTAMATDVTTTGQESSTTSPMSTEPSTTLTSSATTSTADDSSSTQPADTSDASSSGGSTGDVRQCSGELPTAWPDGVDCPEPDVTVHRYDANTFILRQSLCTSFEGPFMYMLFGDTQVLLEDTGAGGIDIAGAVSGVIEQWLTENDRATIELLVVNSHAHGDHVAGNSMFDGQPGVTVVTPSVAGLSGYFGIDDWPAQIVQHDLGGRLIDVIPIPGHQQSHIALFDHATGWLLTGDTLYPGRLYIDDFPTYVESIGRMVAHVSADEVCNVMGTHVEMTNVPGVDFEFGADEHPDEHPLQLDYAHLVELRDAVEAMASPEIEVHDDFIVYPL